MESPSKVAVPRPISSRITRERGLAWFRIAAVSTISTMKVERPRARSSAAPTRLNSRSTTPIWAARAGTKAPIWASTAISAFWRRKVDLPAILGPVSSQRRWADPEIAVIGDEAARLLGAQRRLHHRMAPGLDLEGRRSHPPAGGNSRPRPRARPGRRRHRAAPGRRRRPRSPRRQPLASATSSAKQFELQGQGLVGRRGDAALELAQLHRGEARRIGHGLAMDEARRFASASPDGSPSIST